MSKQKKITKKAVTEAANRFYRERERWGEGSLSTINAEIAYRELEKVWKDQTKVLIFSPTEGYLDGIGTDTIDWTGDRATAWQLKRYDAATRLVKIQQTVSDACIVEVSK